MICLPGGGQEQILLMQSASSDYRGDADIFSGEGDSVQYDQGRLAML